MLAIMKGHIGCAFMHILLCIVALVLLVDMPSIGVTRVGLMSDGARLSRSCSRVRSTLWLRAPCSPVVHAGGDPCLYVPLFYALVGPLPCSHTSQ